MENKKEGDLTKQIKSVNGANGVDLNETMGNARHIIDGVNDIKAIIDNLAPLINKFKGKKKQSSKNSIKRRKKRL
jgi:ABC-type transporter Mla subunit MlaD